MTFPRPGYRLLIAPSVGAMLLLSACGNSGPTTRFVDDDEEVADETAPELSHDYDPAPREYGEAVFLGADVTDEHAIVDVKIVFQRETDGKEWTELRMAPLANTYYEGTIPGREVSSGGIRYYIEAEDEFGNVGCLPEACSTEAWHFPVVPPRN